MIMQRQSQSQVKTIPNLPIVTISNSIIILDHLQEHAGRVPFYGGRGPAAPLAPVAPHQPDAQAQPRRAGGQVTGKAQMPLSVSLSTLLFRFPPLFLFHFPLIFTMPISGALSFSNAFFSGF